MATFVGRIWCFRDNIYSLTSCLPHPFLLHLRISQLNCHIAHTCSTYSKLPVKPHDIWSCFAWCRRRARGDKPLHVTPRISSNSQSEAWGARASQRKRERERAVGTVTYILCRALFSVRYSIAQCCMHLQLFLLTPNQNSGRPAWVRLGWGSTRGWGGLWLTDSYDQRSKRCHTELF